MLINDKLSIKLRVNEKFNRICSMDRRHLMAIGDPYWKIWDHTKRSVKKRSFCAACFEKTHYFKLYNEEKEKRACLNQNNAIL